MGNGIEGKHLTDDGRLVPCKASVYECHYRGNLEDEGALTVALEQSVRRDEAKIAEKEARKLETKRRNNEYRRVWMKRKRREKRVKRESERAIEAAVSSGGLMIDHLPKPPRRVSKERRELFFGGVLPVGKSIRVTFTGEGMEFHRKVDGREKRLRVAYNETDFTNCDENLKILWRKLYDECGRGEYEIYSESAPEGLDGADLREWNSDSQLRWVVRDGVVVAGAVGQRARDRDSVVLREGLGTVEQSEVYGSREWWAVADLANRADYINGRFAKLAESHGVTVPPVVIETDPKDSTNAVTVFKRENGSLSLHGVAFDEPFVMLNDRDTIDETINHEFAHVLVPGDDHGPVWRQKFIELGGDGEQFDKSGWRDRPESNRWVLECPDCHHVVYTNKKSVGGLLCDRCDSAGHRAVFTVRENAAYFKRDV